MADHRANFRLLFSCVVDCIISCLHIFAPELSEGAVGTRLAAVATPLLVAAGLARLRRPVQPMNHYKWRPASAVLHIWRLNQCNYTVKGQRSEWDKYMG
jgi:hypothetical protein